MKKTIILIAVALLNTAAFAQTTWNNDKMHSKVQFTITHLAVSDVDGEFKDLALKEDLGVKEVQARAERILSEGDIQLPTGLLTEAEGQLRPVTRSAREILQEADQDLSVGAILKKCLTGG